MPDSRLRVYIAGPYTKPDPCVNTHKAVEFANLLLDNDFLPWLPHLSHFWHTMTPKPYEEWMAYDAGWLATCHAFYRLPGESNGADLEEALAHELGIPVFHCFRELLAWREMFLVDRAAAAEVGGVPC